jgi:hypothetical protein
MSKDPIMPISPPVLNGDPWPMPTFLNGMKVYDSDLEVVCVNCNMRFRQHQGNGKTNAGWSCLNKNTYFKDPNRLESAKTSAPVSNQSVVNDHTCPTCKNDRCSKSEKTCWKCGNKL